jgi:2-C-methyl-D-erythritol 4-phosphate cytidylyltransferase
MRRTDAASGVAAVLLAGGASTRFDHELGKVQVPVAGRPLLAHCLATLDASELVDHLVLVVRTEDRPAIERIVEGVGPASLRAVVGGGATRHDSETAGLEAVAALGDVGWVMLHDAARPFVTHALLRRLVDTARSRGVGVVPARPIDAPVVDVSGRAVDDSGLVTVQTPQLFAVEDVLPAYRLADEHGLRGVDTAETVAAYCDTPIEVVDGDPRNIKVTTLADLRLAEEWAAEWRDGHWASSAG